MAPTFLQEDWDPSYLPQLFQYRSLNTSGIIFVNIWQSLRAYQPISISSASLINIYFKLFTHFLAIFRRSGSAPPPDQPGPSSQPEVIPETQPAEISAAITSKSDALQQF